MIFAGTIWIPLRKLQERIGGSAAISAMFNHVHVEGKCFKLPQAFFMQVATGPALREIDHEARAIEFYRLLTSFDFMASTPTRKSGDLPSWMYHQLTWGP